ncbi:hypothetical protein EGH22_00250 [Halomicroarcula sp. F28]|uniref:hypothetical protein n=1 Tax=Haloarcula salinisoli TaxID=2487746 RepID=UPI001C72C4BB|nr:hypothetical protein [Halomicroarcula salinisoli]MBX0284747.1 hypothetical protein [Halomicroarcula salinisoli]
MTDDGYTPLVDREREAKSRVHEELTRPARERIAEILSNLEHSNNNQKRLTRKALDSTMELIGRTPVLKHVSSDSGDEGIDVQRIHHAFMLGGKTVHILTYTEQTLTKYKGYEMRRASAEKLQRDRGDVTNQSGAIGKIRKVLVTEGLLWEIEWAGSGGAVQFVPLESEAMGNMDAKVQALAEKEPWEEALQGYNDAFERYLNGDFDDTLVTKLYNSIEEVLQTICVDLEGWTEDRDKSHGDYLEMLNENGVYDANGITAPELNQLLDALEKMVSKVGHDRKQRHAYHDRAYCTLLIHQVGAYLYFLISRYEDYAN